MGAFVKEKSLPWPQFCDGQKFKSPMAQKYSVWAIPMLFLIDKSGTVREIGVEGPRLQTAIKKLLDEKTP
jgi:hypothetical protein